MAALALPCVCLAHLAVLQGVPWSLSSVEAVRRSLAHRAHLDRLKRGHISQQAVGAPADAIHSELDGIARADAIHSELDSIAAKAGARKLSSSRAVRPAMATRWKSLGLSNSDLTTQHTAGADAIRSELDSIAANASAGRR